MGLLRRFHQSSRKFWQSALHHSDCCNGQSLQCEEPSLEAGFLVHWDDPYSEHARRSWCIHLCTTGWDSSLGSCEPGCVCSLNIKFS